MYIYRRIKSSVSCVNSKYLGMLKLKLREFRILLRFLILTNHLSNLEKK